MRVEGNRSCGLLSVAASAPNPTLSPTSMQSSRDTYKAQASFSTSGFTFSMGKKVGMQNPFGFPLESLRASLGIY